MEERLSVIIDADIKNFQQGMARVESNLNRAQGIFKKASNAIFQTENAIAKLSKSFKEGAITNVQYSARLAHLNAELVKQRSNLSASSKEVNRLNKMMSSQASRQVVSSNQAASQSFQGLTKSVRGSSGVAIEFSRIIQDAPFGLIGIGNNIQQLTQNFANLKKNAGSTGAAIKASLAAMISPANLLVLGISAITAAFTAYQMGAFDFLSSTKDAGKAAEEASEKLDKYRKSLDGVSRANIEGAASAEKEIQSFQLLRAQAENANIPLNDRIEAVKDLKKEFPDYLANLTDEQILTGDVGDSYKNLTQQIISTAKARAASDAIAENSLKLLTLEDQLNKNLEEQKRLGLVTSQKAVAISGSGATVITEQQKAEQKINELKSDQLAILEQIVPIKEDDLRLTNEINKNISEGGRFTKNLKKGTEGANEELTEYQKTVQELIAMGLKIKADFDIEFDKSRSPGETAKRIGEALTPKEIVDIPIKINLNKDQLSEEQEKVIAAISNMQEAMRKLAVNIDGILENELGRAFSNFGSSIGEALIEGTSVLQAIGQSFLGSMASFLGKFGEQLIAYGVAGLAFSSATKAMTNPITAAPAAIAAIAAGTAMTLAAGAIGGIAKGGFKGGSGGSGGGTGASQSFGGSMAPTAGLSQSHGFTNASAFNPGTMDITLNARIGNDAIYLSNKSEENKRNRI